MADTYSDDDPDAAAMAEAMGFTGFGMQRNKKRKQPDPSSQTGANNAPLGKRRLPMNLPKPAVVSGGGDDGNNPEEIDLDDDDDDDDDGEGGVDVGAAGGVDGEEDGQAIVNERAAALTVDDGPSISAPQQQQQHHSLPPRPQQHQQQSHHHGAPRPGGRGHGGQTPWWEGTWDPRLISRMIENPWDRLEKQRGLEARGTWPSPSAAARGGGGGGPAVAAAAFRDNDNEGVEDMGSSGVATAKA